MVCVNFVLFDSFSFRLPIRITATQYAELSSAIRRQDLSLNGGLSLACLEHLQVDMEIALRHVLEKLDVDAQRIMLGSPREFDLAELASCRQEHPTQETAEGRYSRLAT